jgi:hypothetical protein
VEEIAQGGRNQLSGGLGLIHRLGFQRFPDAAEPSINGGANANFGK